MEGEAEPQAMSVYIPTVGRPGILCKTVPRWLEQDIRPIRLVVPAREYDAHVRLRDEQEWEGVCVTGLPPDNWGIGASRRFCVEHASRQGYSTIIMCDDEYRPLRKSDARLLLDEAEDPYCLGIGAVRGLTDRFNQGKLSALSKAGAGAILCPGGWGFVCFALNVKNAIGVGNYDAGLSFCEDAELARNGIDNGMPWRVHCDVWAEALNKRYGEGGINSLFRSPQERKADEDRCLRLIESRWPKYQVPIKDGAASRMYWQRMLDDYLPAWRGLSALHGGSLAA
jgi:TET-Associated Glycosyltransferase